MNFRLTLPKFSPRASLLVLALLAVGLAACGSPGLFATPTPTTPPLADELVFYDWADDLPQSVQDAFKAEYGVKVTYLTYNSSEEAAAQLRSGQHYDVVVMDYSFIAPLAANGLLAEIDYRNVPNFKNISANFRDLAFDPGNAHSVPFSYGTTGLLVRGDLVKTPITRWADLWDPRYAGKIAVRAQPSELIGIALKSLGYPLNSEDPQQLDAALRRLLDLKPSVTIVGDTTEAAIPTLLSGKAVVMAGWAQDALQATQANKAVLYVLPEEGTLVWGDAFVLPADSSQKYTAELFLNFLLRPEIGAQIVNASDYATANQAAYPLINPEIRSNPIVFPPGETITKADWYLPLSPAGQKRYDDIWVRFLAGGP